MRILNSECFILCKVTGWCGSGDMLLTPSSCDDMYASLGYMEPDVVTL